MHAYSKVMHSSTDVTRREFIAQAALAIVYGSGRSIAVAARNLRIALVLPSDKSARVADSRAGVELALSETERAAELFGQRITLLNRAASDLLTKEKVSVVIGGLTDADALELAKVADESHAIFMNIGSATALRGESCRRATYHVWPSESMISAAKSALSNPAADVRIELWNETLEKYGGSQLNDRYRARAGRPMTSSAWAGWFAVKAAWDASLRANDVSASAIARVLDNPSTQFDGHKGSPLSFRAWDHQLRQPLYAVTHAAGTSAVVAELPDVGRGGQSMQQELDRFGDDSATTRCRFAR